MKSSYLLIAALFLLPFSAQADQITPAASGDTFDTLQSLVLSVQAINPSTPLPNHGTVPLPLNSPIELSYQISHRILILPDFPSAGNGNDAYLANYLKSNKLYLELWEGTPFTSDAHMLQNWDITSTSTGEVTAEFPNEGPYFFVTYFPDGYYINPQSACPNDDSWQIDCAPKYSLDQMREYFDYPLDSPSAFPYLPDAFGGIEFSVTALATHPTTSNVLFLPGIESSRLYMRNSLGLEQTLWEPQLLGSISNLALNTDGTSKHEIYTRDLVDYRYGIKALGDVYGPFEDFMNSLVANGVILKWQAYPYDWRFDVQDIVADGTLTGNSTGPLTRAYLTDIVQELASTSPTGKVTIIAHSNGGLLAKALALKLQAEGKTNLLDQIIFIGTPQLGTPATIGDVLNGDGQTDALGGLIMYGDDVRKAAATMPGMYGLLPSSDYFSQITDALVLFPNTLTNLFGKYFGEGISTEEVLENFLADIPGIDENFPTDDLRTPEVLSSQILQKEFQTHALLDSWTPPDGVALTTISGWGNPTPYQYSYSTSNKKILNCFRSSLFSENCIYSYQANHTVKNTESGDDTVASVSALANSLQNFYFNAESFGADKLGAIGHGNLTSAAPIEFLIQNLIENKNTSLAYISTTSPDSNVSPSIVISVHSPINIEAADADGNETGIFPIPGENGIYFEKRNIPGSSIQTLDDEKYLYLPESVASGSSSEYKISLQGYDEGESTIDFGILGSDGNTSTLEEFSSIPTTPSTTAAFTLSINSSDVSNSASSPTFPSTLEVDIFGDGSTTEFVASSSDSRLTAGEIISILKKEFSSLAVRRGIKNRFLSELLKIQNLATPADQQSEILALEKLIQAQTDLKLTNSQGVFFLQLLDQLKTLISTSMIKN
jgi:pimeloyl-ACP methyl ester carboxylesterase